LDSKENGSIFKILKILFPFSNFLQNNAYQAASQSIFAFAERAVPFYARSGLR
jgi:hypothetical protein